MKDAVATHVVARTFLECVGWVVINKANTEYRASLKIFLYNLSLKESCAYIKFLVNKCGLFYLQQAN